MRAHRHLRLPADDRTPAVARAAVRQVLLAGGRADQLDEALLLVSELSTNGVVHAGTPVEVDVLADEHGVTIMVSDRKSGLVGSGAGGPRGPFDLIAASAPVVSDPGWEDTPELEERGRGLLLVDRLASSWGTAHHATGKSVWFRLGDQSEEPLLPVHVPTAPDADFVPVDSVPVDPAAGRERWRIAQELRETLSPPELPVAPGIEFGAAYVPAGFGEVGGDFYDVFPVRRNRWFLAVGDVCGKGNRTAVVTGVVREVMRVLIGDDRPMERMLGALNRTLLRGGPGQYATVATAMVTRLEIPSRPRVLEVSLCLAGHEPPILVHADGTTRAVGESGTALGSMEQIEAPEMVVTLRQGESLVFVTDGVTERRDGSRRYGAERLRTLLEGLPAEPAQTLATAVRDDVHAFSAEPQRDAVAVLVLQNPGQR